MSPIEAALARLKAEAGTYQPTHAMMAAVAELERSIAEVAKPKVRGWGRAPKPRAKPPIKRKRTAPRLSPPRAMTIADWTADAVMAWLNEATETLRALPIVRGPQGYKSCMPSPVRQPFEDAAPGQASLARSWPSPDAIDRLDVVLTWREWLGPQDWRLLYRWVSGEARSALSSEYGVHRETIRVWVIEIAKTVAAHHRRQLQASADVAKSGW